MRKQAEFGVEYQSLRPACPPSFECHPIITDFIQISNSLPGGTSQKTDSGEEDLGDNAGFTPNDFHSQTKNLGSITGVSACSRSLDHLV